MAEHSGRATMRRIIEGMRADPGTLEGVVEAARAQSPRVAALPRDEMRHRVAPVLAAVSAAFIDGTGPDVRAADQLAADRAMQGIPLAALLDGFQAGRLYVLRKVIEQGHARGVPTDQLMEVLIELDGYANKMQNQLIHSYRETELSLARTADAVRFEALRRLLHDGPASCAADAGLNPAQRYHCVATGLSDPGRARRAELGLIAAGGIAGMVDGYLCVVTPCPPDVGSVREYLAVIAPKTRPDRLARTYQECRQAREAGSRRGLLGLRTVTELAPAVLLDSQPDLARLLADDLLARLDPASDLHRQLARTALAYLAHGGRADRTAAALHLHPNTVKHRLRRLSALTSFARPAHPGEAFAHGLRWWWALHTWLDQSET